MRFIRSAEERIRELLLVTDKQNVEEVVVAEDRNLSTSRIRRVFRFIMDCPNRRKSARCQKKKKTLCLMLSMRKSQPDDEPHFT
jgi:hypothetical protein